MAAGRRVQPASATTLRSVCVASSCGNDAHADWAFAVGLGKRPWSLDTPTKTSEHLPICGPMFSQGRARTDELAGRVQLSAALHVVLLSDPCASLAPWTQSLTLTRSAPVPLPPMTPSTCSRSTRDMMAKIDQIADSWRKSAAARWGTSSAETRPMIGTDPLPSAGLLFRRSAVAALNMTSGTRR